MLIKALYFRDQENIHDFGYERHNQLYVETLGLAIGFLSYSTIFCPSLFFMLFVYVPLYLTIHVTYLYLRFDMTDDTIFFDNMRLVFTFVAQGLLFFVLV